MGLNKKIFPVNLFRSAVELVFLMVLSVSAYTVNSSSGPRDTDRNGVIDNCSVLGDISGYKVGYPGNDSSYAPISDQTVYMNSGGPKLFSADARLNWGQGGVANRELTSIQWMDRYRDCGGAGYSSSCTTVVDTSTMSRPASSPTVDGAWTWQNGFPTWVSQSGSTINFTDPYGNPDSADITAWWPTTTANPYSFTGIPSCGTNHISVARPSNWIVGSTLCYNDTSCHNNSPVLEDFVGGITVPAAGFADLWWHFWPRTPNNMTATCSPAGDRVTLTWTPPASAGVDSYYVRVNDPSNDAAGCPGGWFCNTTGEVSSGQHPNTTYGPFAVIPGRTYTWWLHSTVSGHPNIWSDMDSGPAFMCVNTLSISSLTVSPNPADPNVLRNITATRDPSSTAPGNINYSFWWDCNNPSKDVTVVEGDPACGDLPSDAPGGGCTINNAGAKCDGETSNSMTVPYSDYATNATVKVIMEQGTAKAERRTPVNVNLGVSCFADQNFATMVDDIVTWTAVPSGGSGSYNFTWSGSDPLDGADGNPVYVIYTSSGTKTGAVTVNDGLRSVGPVECDNSPISITGRFIDFNVAPRPINSGQSTIVTWETEGFTICTLTDDNPSTHIDGQQVADRCDSDRRGGGNGNGRGGFPSCPALNLASTTIFTMICDGVMRSVSVLVKPPPSFIEIPPR